MDKNNLCTFFSCFSQHLAFKNRRQSLQSPPKYKYMYSYHTTCRITWRPAHTHSRTTLTCHVCSNILIQEWTLKHVKQHNRKRGGALSQRKRRKCLVLFFHVLVSTVYTKYIRIAALIRYFNHPPAKPPKRKSLTYFWALNPHFGFKNNGSFFFCILFRLSIDGVHWFYVW